MPMRPIGRGEQAEPGQKSTALRHDYGHRSNMEYRIVVMIPMLAHIGMLWPFSLPARWHLRSLLCMMIRFPS